MVNLEEHREFIAAVEKGDRVRAAAVIRDEHWSWQKHKPYFMKFYDFGTRSTKSPSIVANQRPFRS